MRVSQVKFLIMAVAALVKRLKLSLYGQKTGNATKNLHAHIRLQFVGKKEQRGSNSFEIMKIFLVQKTLARNLNLKLGALRLPIGTLLNTEDEVIKQLTKVHIEAILLLLSLHVPTGSPIWIMSRSNE